MALASNRPLHTDPDCFHLHSTPEVCTSNRGMFGGGSTVKKRSTQEPIKVFRIALLGSPEIGKTSFASLYNTNRVFDVYNHTRKPKFYCRDFSRRTLAFYRRAGDDNDEDKKKAKENAVTKKKSKRRKNRNDGPVKTLDRYGVQMIDVPGEIHQDVAPKTEEVGLLTATIPSNFLKTASDEAGESAPLLTRTLISQQHNRLHDVILPHTFIICFDFNEENTFQKALTIAKFIRDETNNSELWSRPIFFFGNKVDRVSSKEDSDRNWQHFTKEVRNLNDSEKVGEMTVHRGSIKRNFVYENSLAETMTVEEYVDYCVQKLNEAGIYSTGEDEEKRKKKDRQNASRLPESDSASDGSSKSSATDTSCACNCIVQ
jgi:hypothetical protein